MIYLDNAATGFPKSKPALIEMIKAYSICGNAGRSGYNIAVEASRRLYECREALGEMFGTEAENVILTQNTTMALNMAVKGAAGRSVVISNLEHNSVYRPVYALSQAGTEMNIFEVDLYDDNKTVKNFIEAGDGADTAVITHASNVCGRILPVERIISEAKKMGMTVIVDAAQTAGHFPVNMQKNCADILCVAGHKGLYGPLGTGAMLINRNFKGKLKTIIEGGSGVSSLEPDMPEVYPERFEAGTQNPVAFSGLTEALKNFEYTDDAESQLFEYLLGEIKNIDKVILYGEPRNNINKYTPVLLFNIEGKSCNYIADELSMKDICVRGGYHCSPLAHTALGSTDGGVRVSIGRCNSKRDINKFINAVNKLAK